MRRRITLLAMVALLIIGGALPLRAAEVLPTPYGLEAYRHDHLIELNWKYWAAGDVSTTGFRIYRSTDGGTTWSRYGEVSGSPADADARRFWDEKPQIGQNHYRVTALGPNGTESAATNIAVISFPLGDRISRSRGWQLPAPGSLSATGVDDGIELRWQYGRHGDYRHLSHFEVYRSLDGGITGCLYAKVQWEPPAKADREDGSTAIIPDPHFIDANAPAGGWTVYYVKAVSKEGEASGRSNTAAAYPLSGGVSNATCGTGSTLADSKSTWEAR